MSGNGDRVPVDVVGVRVELPSNSPIVLLRERTGNRYLPIWIGAPEAQAIVSALDGVEPPRPQTHDLLRSVIDTLGGVVEGVEVVDLRDNIFFADLVINQGGRTVRVSSRPSDAIALAVRVEAPVFVAPQVLLDAGIEFSEESEEDEIERFRELLEDVTVEDFLRDVDPES
ncbi:MAG TPA: bifunctional nuclease family protein [Acidimicrobiia bacterium]|nr:bifunctional nuclease family protein [Acidimicrobiia bacterium]